MDRLEVHDSRAVTQRQFHAFNEAGTSFALTDGDRCRLLAMSPDELAAWNTFLDGDGPPPQQPAAPAMLLRLANATYRLAVRSERTAQGSMRAVAVPLITSLPS